MPSSRTEKADPVPAPTVHPECKLKTIVTNDSEPYWYYFCPHCLVKYDPDEFNMVEAEKNCDAVLKAKRADYRWAFYVVSAMFLVSVFSFLVLSGLDKAFVLKAVLSIAILYGISQLLFYWLTRDHL